MPSASVRQRDKQNAIIILIHDHRQIQPQINCHGVGTDNRGCMRPALRRAPEPDELWDPDKRLQGRSEGKRNRTTDIVLLDEFTVTSVLVWKL